MVIIKSDQAMDQTTRRGLRTRLNIRIPSSTGNSAKYDSEGFGFLGFSLVAFTSVSEGFEAFPGVLTFWSFPFIQYRAFGSLG
jgi:hypothetical protein